jgi:phage repressor protein C with HTH and peptisase S24 domain
MEKRLKKAMRELGLTQILFSEKTGINTNAIRHMSAGAKQITPEIAAIIEAKLGISAAWLLLGVGDMFDKPAGTLSKAFDDYTGSRYAVSYYPDVKASAGNGYFNDDTSEIEIISLPKAIIDKKLSVGKIDAIKVHGDSMHPTIKENDIIFVATNMREVYDNKIYVIRYEEEIRVKRIFKRRGEKVLLRSDNTIYPDEEISIYDEAIAVLGQVIYNMADLS